MLMKRKTTLPFPDDIPTSEEMATDLKFEQSVMCDRSLCTPFCYVQVSPDSKLSHEMDIQSSDYKRLSF